MLRLALLAALAACSSKPAMTTPDPATPPPAPPPATGSGSDMAPPAQGSGSDMAPGAQGSGSAAGDPAATGPKLGETCGPNDTCGEGTCVTYYGIAGPRGPAFKSCEIKCAGGTPCPATKSCVTVADGPGQVCR